MGQSQSALSEEELLDECGDPLQQYRVLNSDSLQTKGWNTDGEGLPVYVSIRGLGGCYFWGHRCYQNGVRTAAVQPLDPLAKPNPATGVTNMFIGPMREVPYERVKFVEMLIEKFMPEVDLVRIIAKEPGTSTPVTWQWKWSQMQHVEPHSPESEALNILRVDFPETAFTAHHPVNPPVMRTDTHAVQTIPTQPQQPQTQPRQPPMQPQPSQMRSPPAIPRASPTPSRRPTSPQQIAPARVPAPSPTPPARRQTPSPARVPPAAAFPASVSPPPPVPTMPAGPTAAEEEEEVITAFRIV